jgi:hypothetical protein
MGIIGCEGGLDLADLYSWFQKLSQCPVAFIDEKVETRSGTRLQEIIGVAVGKIPVKGPCI